MSTYSKEYYEKHKEKMNEHQKAWRKKNLEKSRAYARAYYHAHSKEIKIKQRERNRLYNKTEKYKIGRRLRQRKYRQMYGQPRYKTIYLNGKNVLYHRWLMEQHLGRKLLKTEIIHHLDHDRLNNDLSNLAIMTNAEHSLHHHPIRLK